jgi:hypothetical protein
MLVAMVNREVVLETIRKMHSSGIEDSVIEATLKDIGLSEEETGRYIAEVKGTVTQPTAVSLPAEQHKAIAERTAEKIKAHLDEEREERELRDTGQHAAIEEQHRRLEDVDQKMGTLHERVEALATPANKELNDKLSVLEGRVSGLERQLADLKAISSATKDLMEKVLEVNRKILNKL